MKLENVVATSPARVAALAPVALVLILSFGCTSNPQTPATDLPAPSTTVEVVGELVAVKDDRPVDGGIDLTLETGEGIQEVVRVPSSFIAGPRDTVLAMHAVVDSARVGDRLRARGTRDETGALRPVALELVRGE
jgi:hypothetical protein